MARTLTAETAKAICPKRIPNLILTKQGWSMKSPKGNKLIRAVRYGVPDDLVGMESEFQTGGVPVDPKPEPDPVDKVFSIQAPSDLLMSGDKFELIINATSGFEAGEFESQIFTINGEAATPVKSSDTSKTFEINQADQIKYVVGGADVIEASAEIELLTFPTSGTTNIDSGERKYGEPLVVSAVVTGATINGVESPEANASFNVVWNKPNVGQVGTDKLSFVALTEEDNATYSYKAVYKTHTSPNIGTFKINVTAPPVEGGETG